jgi:hypothetical protein
MFGSFILTYWGSQADQWFPALSLIRFLAMIDFNQIYKIQFSVQKVTQNKMFFSFPPLRQSSSPKNKARFSGSIDFISLSIPGLWILSCTVNDFHQMFCFIMHKKKTAIKIVKRVMGPSSGCISWQLLFVSAILKPFCFLHLWS